MKTNDSKLTAVFFFLFFFFFLLFRALILCRCSRKIFKVVKFSENGSNARNREENANMLFLDYLDVCGKGI